MTTDDGESRLGTVTLTPDESVEVGSRGTWTLTYTAGRYGLDDGGSLIVATRQVADWGPPQAASPTAANYVSATTTAEARLSVRFSPQAYIRPWRQGIIVMAVDGHVAPGDTITMVLGDRSSGAPGLLMQTFPERRFELRVFVDCFGSGDYRPIAESPSLAIVAGTATRLVAVGPSIVRTGEPTWVLVRALDRWGNPAPTYDGTVEFINVGPDVEVPTAHQFRPEDRGCCRLTGIHFATPGTYCLRVRDTTAGFTATANPCICRTATDATPAMLFWGDPRGQSEETVGTGDVEAYWTYLRDSAGVDFGAHCGNDFQISTDFYAKLRDVVQRFHEPGRFIPFLAYEWSGNHTAGGDHNVYMLHDDPDRSPIHRSSHWQVTDHSDAYTDRYPVRALRDEMRNRDDVLILPHVGGRRTRLDTVDDVRQSPVIEIASVHGRFPWFAREALEQGLKVGFIAGSDDHTGRPGASPPTNTGLICWGGLTAIYATALTREALWKAWTERHCYGTTGARIIVDIDADGHMMGDEYRAATPPYFKGRIMGTAPVTQIELRRGWAVIWRYDAISASPPTWNGGSVRCRMRVVWSGAESKNRNKVTNWNGGLTLEGGRIIAVEPYNFAHPAEGISDWDVRQVCWESRTSGDEDGVVLDMEVGHDAVIHFDTPPLRRAFPLRDIGAEREVIDAGGTDRRVELRWVRAEAGPLDVEWSYRDERPIAGEHAYWLWVTQADGEWAWSSPIFVTIP